MESLTLYRDLPSPVLRLDHDGDRAENDMVGIPGGESGAMDHRNGTTCLQRLSHPTFCRRAG
jgi:hypothetical protein